VRDLPAYQPGQKSPGPEAGKLSSNESPLGPGPAVRSALAAAAASVNRYPQYSDAVRQLASYAGVAADQLMLTNGSDELCFLLAWVFLDHGRIAVAGDPCYQIDAMASVLARARLRRVPLRHGAHDLDEMADAARDASLVWLPSPHNPTGAVVWPAELEGFLARVPSGCVVVVDEAYRAFADPLAWPDVPRLLREHPNLLVQRTLSKDWALAGLRIGYALASPAVIAALTRVRPPFSVSTIALAAVDAGLREDSWRQMSVARVREQRELLEGELARLGIEHFPSQANFVTARLDHARLAPALEASGIVVRPGEDLGMPGWVRISIGWAPQMAVLRRVLRTLCHNDGTGRHA
jgi:histidinol-phosphate aminotransferase